MNAVGAISLQIGMLTEASDLVGEYVPTSWVSNRALALRDELAKIQSVLDANGITLPKPF